MLNRYRLPVFFLLACSSLSSAACSSSKDDGNKGKTEEKYLGLEMPKEGEGFQVRSLGMPIPAGEDLEYCEVAEFPGEEGDVFWASSIEFANGKNSHHLIIDVAKKGGAAEAVLADHEIGDRVPCISSQSQFGDGFEFVGGSQSPYSLFEHPKGVGRKFYGKQRFIFDYHYYNTTDDTVQAQSALNVHLAKEEDVEHIAQIFNFSNMTIDTPPGGKTSFTGECKVTEDIKLMSLTRHTHRWGTGYEVWFAGGPQDGEQIFSSPDFEHDLYHSFESPIDVKTGEGFRFRCDFVNTENHALRFGPNATDEMCILFGLWWSETSNSPPSQDCTMTQIGEDGVARTGKEGGFPKPTEEQVTACKERSESSQLASSAECAACTCDSCAAVIDKCQKDEHCGPILECFSSAGCTGRECLGPCQEVINEHSPGTGPLIQVGECVTSSCTGCGL
jgi:hypothetical protein